MDRFVVSIFDARPVSTTPSPATLPPPPTNTRPPTSWPAGGVVRDQSPERNVDDVALGYPSARTRRDPLRYVFENVTCLSIAAPANYATFA